jgi:hypothetical protein
MDNTPLKWTIHCKVSNINNTNNGYNNTEQTFKLLYFKSLSYFGILNTFFLSCTIFSGQKNILVFYKLVLETKD